MMSSWTRCSCSNGGSSSRHRFRYHIAICRARELRNTIGGAHFSTFVSSSHVGHQAIQHTHTHIHTLAHTQNTHRTQIHAAMRHTATVVVASYSRFSFTFWRRSKRSIFHRRSFFLPLLFYVFAYRMKRQWRREKKLLARERNFSNKHKVIKSEAKKSRIWNRWRRRRSVDA